MIFNDADIQKILAALRDGETVRVESSGGRYATTYAYRDGAYRVTRFEEGLVDEYVYDAAAMSAFIARTQDSALVRLVVQHRAPKP